MARKQQIVVSLILCVLSIGLMYLWLYTCRRSDGSFIKAGSSPRELVAAHWPLFAGLALMALQPALTIVLKDSEPHFSLRTLLLATTLVALMLGLVAWIAR
jgi:hypothetical protein